MNDLTSVLSSFGDTINGSPAPGYTTSPEYTKYLQLRNQMMDQYLNGSFLGMDRNTLQGLNGTLGGLSSLGGLYFDWQKNKMAKDAFKMEKAEYNRGVEKDKQFANNLNKSGLGTYSAGV